MADRTPDNPELAVDELKRKARRRLVGAVVLALAAAVLLPMLLEKEPRPLGEDVSVKIPPIDEGRFVSKLSGKEGAPAAPVAKPSSPAAAAKIETAAAPAAPPKGETAPAAAPAEPAKAEPAKAEPAPPAAATAKPEAATPAPTKTAPAAAPAPTTPKRSVAEAEQRMLSPSSKPAAPAAAKAAAPAPATETPPATPAASAAPAASPPAAPVVSAAAPPAPPAKAESPPAAAPKASAPAPQGFIVQLAAFADDKGANALAGRLKRGGYAAYVEPLQTSRGTLWRVRVGGYPTRAEADAASEKLRAEGQKPIVVPAR